MGTRVNPYAAPVKAAPLPRSRPRGVPFPTSFRSSMAFFPSPKEASPASMATARVQPASMVSSPTSLQMRFSSAMSSRSSMPQLAPSAQSDSYSRGATW